MMELCKLKNDWKDEKYITYSMWDKIRSLTVIIADIADWMKLPSDSLEACLKGADIFYKGVAGFGHGHFGTGDKKQCDMECVPLLGDPRNLI